MSEDKKSKGDCFVYSTLSNDQRYTLWKASKDGSPNVAIGSVFIAGKANVTNKKLDTPKGIVTRVTDEQMDILKQSDGFKSHVNNGFITVDSVETDPEKAAKNMKAKDKSAQLIDADFEKPPVLNEAMS